LIPKNTSTLKDGIKIIIPNRYNIEGWNKKNQFKKIVKVNPTKNNK
jgi:hypothetical protein